MDDLCSPHNSVSCQRDRDKEWCDREYLCSLQTPGVVWVFVVVGLDSLTKLKGEKTEAPFPRLFCQSQN